MHSYPLNLAPGAARDFTAQADLFVYESGAVTPDTGDLRIIVKPDTGGEIVLRPGQRFRLAPGATATNWNVKANDAAVTITGNLIIGAGEFDDANTLNTFKLDGTFTNTVKVNNTTAERVPVSLDVAQTQPVSIVGTVNVAGQTVNYTHSWSDAAIAAQVAQVIIAPSANVNGAYIEFAEFSCAGGTSGTQAAAYIGALIAKAGVAPVSSTDGDVVMAAVMSQTVVNSTNGPTGQLTQKLGARIKLAAGKGLYLNQNGNGATAFKTVLYTIL